MWGAHSPQISQTAGGRLRLVSLLGSSRLLLSSQGSEALHQLAFCASSRSNRLILTLSFPQYCAQMVSSRFPISKYFKRNSKNGYQKMLSIPTRSVGFLLLLSVFYCQMLVVNIRC